MSIAIRTSVSTNAQSVATSTEGTRTVQEGGGAMGLRFSNKQNEYIRSADKRWNFKVG